ncbi:MAG: HRDC domain-containing protein, partial [Gemmatimonadales bacterium]
ARLARLRTALTGYRTPWGGALLDPVALRTLALSPPVDAGELSEVPGVGPVAAERLGRLILEALWDGQALRPILVSSDSGDGAILARLRDWRSRVATEQGCPAWRVASDRLLSQIAAAAPDSREALAKMDGVGPRFVNKYWTDVVAVIADSLSSRSS